MRLNALCLIGCLAASALPLSAGAESTPPAAAVRAAQSEGSVRAAQDPASARTCPPGYYWEPASYAKHGKFRLAHCAPRW